MLTITNTPYHTEWFHCPKTTLYFAISSLPFMSLLTYLFTFVMPQVWTKTLLCCLIWSNWPASNFQALPDPEKDQQGNTYRLFKSLKLGRAWVLMMAVPLLQTALPIWGLTLPSDPHTIIPKGWYKSASPLVEIRGPQFTILMLLPRNFEHSLGPGESWIPLLQ